MLKAAIAKLRSLNPTRDTWIRLGLLAFMVAVFCLPHAAAASWMADASNWLLSQLANLIILAVRGVGYILLMLISALQSVLQYSNFTNPGPTAVQVGWVVTRDLANMFFIVMLMVIALSTAIGWPENYHYSKNLKSLLILAVVINFSKTITGLIIDAGQVVMMTFVNGMSAAMGGNFLNAFQIQTLLELKESGGDASGAGLLLGAALALVMVLVASATVLSLLVMMVWRIVYLWVLTIMSPIAFLSRAVPPFAGKYAEWWKDLKNYVIAGPTAAFFIWLALMTAQMSGGKVANSSDFPLGNTQEASAYAQSGGYNVGDKGIPTQAAQTDVLLSMIIEVALLLAGLKEAGKSGFDLGVGKWAEKKLRGAGSAIGKFAYRQTAGRAIEGAKDVGRYAGGKALAFAGGKMQGAVGAVAGAVGSKLGFAGGLVAARSRAASLRAQADSIRKSGTASADDLKKADKLDANAKRWESYSKFQQPLAKIGALAAIPVTGGLSAVALGAAQVPGAVQAGGKALLSQRDEKVKKEIDTAGKKLSADDAIAIIEGKRIAKDENERSAAYKKAVESGRLDASQVASGRRALQGSADRDTIEAYEKAAADKYATWFKKDGAVDSDKRRSKVEEGEVDFRKLAKSGKQDIIKEFIAGHSASEAKAMLRRYNVPADVISPEMAAKNPVLAQYVLERTATNPDDRTKAMNQRGKDEQKNDISMADILKQTATNNLSAAIANAASSAGQIATAIQEAVMTGARNVNDIFSMSEKEQRAVAKGLNIPNLAKAAQGMAEDDPRLPAIQAMVGVVLANSNGKRRNKIYGNDRYTENRILPDASVVARFGRFEQLGDEEEDDGGGNNNRGGGNRGGGNQGGGGNAGGGGQQQPPPQPPPPAPGGPNPQPAP